jgi:hypothetical protein
MASLLGAEIQRPAASARKVKHEENPKNRQKPPGITEDTLIGGMRVGGG